MRKNKVIKNFIFDIFITILLMILSFLSRKIFLEVMGSNITGLMQLFSQLVGYLNIAELGIGAASTYALYKPLAQKNYQRISEIVSSMKTIYSKIMIFSMVIGIAIGIFIPHIINNNKFENLILYTYWAIIVLSTAFSYRYTYKTVLIIADQNNYIVKIIFGISKLIVIILQIFVIKKFHSYLLYIMLELISVLVQNYIFEKIIRKKYNYLVLKRYIDKSLNRNIINVFFHKIGSVLVFSTDYILISRYISLTILTVYSSYMLIINAILTILGSITNSLTSSVGNYMAEKEEEEIYEMFKLIYSFYYLLSFIVSYSTFNLINLFIQVWIGKRMILDINIIYLLILNLFLTIKRPGIFLFKVGSGYFSDIYLPILEGILNLFFSLIFLHYFGLIGVVIGTVISNILIIEILSPILFYKKVFKKSSKEYLKEYSKNISYCIILFILLEIVLKKFINLKADNYLELFIVGLKILISTSFFSLLIFNLNISFRKKMNIILKKVFLVKLKYYKKLRL